MEAEVDAEEELDFKAVHLGGRHSADLGVVGIVEVLVVEELGSQHDGGNHDTVNVKFSEEEIVALREGVCLCVCREGGGLGWLEREQKISSLKTASLPFSPGSACRCR